MREVTASTSPSVVYHLTGGILNSASCMMHKQIDDSTGHDIEAMAQSDVYSFAYRLFNADCLRCIEA